MENPQDINQKQDQILSYLIESLSPKPVQPSRERVFDDLMTAFASQSPAVTDAQLRQQRTQEMEGARQKNLANAGQLYTLTAQLAQRGNMDAKAAFDFANMYDKPQEILAVLQQAPEKVGANNIFQVGPSAAAAVGAKLQERVMQEQEMAFRGKEFGLKERELEAEIANMQQQRALQGQGLDLRRQEILARQQQVNQPDAKEMAKQRELRAKQIMGETKDEIGADIVSTGIRSVLGKISDSSLRTGLPGSVMSMIPGTGAYDTDKALDVLRANTGFDALQAMRDSSPTGGALGNVTDRELSLLQSTLSNLSLGQSKEQLTNNLQKFATAYGNTIFGTPRAIEKLYAEGFIDEQQAQQALAQRAQFINTSLSQTSSVKPTSQQQAPATGGFRIVQ